ncbi:MAG: hypothetical protein AB8H86_30865 [Polyangiales bacterium]
MKALGALLLSLTFITAAEAQTVRGVPVTFESCDVVLEAEVRAATELEFRTLAPSVHEHLRPGEGLTLVCAPTAIELRVDARSPLSQVIERDTLRTRSRGRVLALTAAELLSAWDETRRLHHTESAAPPIAAAFVPRWGLHLGVLALRSGSPSMRRVGGLVRATYRPKRWLEFELEFGAGKGRAVVDEGAVSSRWYSAAGAIALVLGRRAFTGSLGLGYRVTTALWRGRPSTSTQLGLAGRALWSGPLLRAGTQLRIGRLSASLWGELGYALGGEGLADERVVFSATGLWGSGGVSCGLAFP